MKKVIIDTNGLISFVTDRNVSQQQKIAQLFNDAARLKKIILCHHHVLSEFVYVLSSVYKLSNQDIHVMIAGLVAMPGVEFVADVNMGMVLRYWPDYISDYGDAVIAAYCKTNKKSLIMTFDKKLKNALDRLGLSIHETE